MTLTNNVHASRFGASLQEEGFDAFSGRSALSSEQFSDLVDTLTEETEELIDLEEFYEYEAMSRLISCPERKADDAEFSFGSSQFDGLFDVNSGRGQF